MSNQAKRPVSPVDPVSPKSEPVVVAATPVPPVEPSSSPAAPSVDKKASAPTPVTAPGVVKMDERTGCKLVRSYTESGNIIETWLL